MAKRSKKPMAILGIPWYFIAGAAAVVLLMRSKSKPAATTSPTTALIAPLPFPSSFSPPSFTPSGEAPTNYVEAAGSGVASPTLEI